MEVKWPYPGSRQDALATLEMRRALFKYHFSTSVVMWGLVCVLPKRERGGDGVVWWESEEIGEGDGAGRESGSKWLYKRLVSSGSCHYRVTGTSNRRWKPTMMAFIPLLAARACFIQFNIMYVVPLSSPFIAILLVVLLLFHIQFNGGFDFRVILQNAAENRPIDQQKVIFS